MGHDHLEIPIELDDASWKERCNKRMEELKITKLSGQDSTGSQAGLLHKELVGKKKTMISELYKAVENENVDNFIEVLKQECMERKLPLSDIIINQVTATRGGNRSGQTRL